MNSLGIYIHIPFCKQKCSYCDFAAYEKIEAYEAAYVDALCKEISIRSNEWPQLQSMTVDTIYFGGGTPTHLKISSLAAIMDRLHETFCISKNVELSVESNPGERDGAYLQSLRSLGFNRISFGIQCMDDSLLKTLRRTHTSKDVVTTVELARKVGFRHINGDFIYALPTQTLDDLGRTLSYLDELPLDHVSIYGLQLEPGTYLHRLVEIGDMILPTEDSASDMYDFMIDTCEAKGFVRYEISNFAKNKSYSRHNLKYWSYKPYVGFGAGAYGFINPIRYGNEPYVVPYINGVNANYNNCKKKAETSITFEKEREHITQQRSREDFTFLHLRTKWGLDPTMYESIFNRSFSADYEHILSGLIHKGLLEYSDVEKNMDRKTYTYHLTREGMKYGNYVFSSFIE